MIHTVNITNCEQFYFEKETSITALVKRHKRGIPVSIAQIISPSSSFSNENFNKIQLCFKRMDTEAIEYINMVAWIALIIIYTKLNIKITGVYANVGTAYDELLIQLNKIDKSEVNDKTFAVAIGACVAYMVYDVTTLDTSNIFKDTWEILDNNNKEKNKFILQSYSLCTRNLLKKLQKRMPIDMTDG